ncbi:thioesterase [Enterococcus hirae]|nr:thioesterase [Enterococcus hirae]
MGKKYTIEHEVMYSEGDLNGTITLENLISVAILASEKQTAEMDRGNPYLQKQGLGWIITQYDLKITALPKVGETVKITTEATSYNRFFCYRFFRIYDENGKEIVLIRSSFALLNYKTRRSARVTPEIVAPFDSENTNKLLRFPPIEHFKIEPAQGQPYRVRFFDIDSNQHVNNAKYLTWMTDPLGMDFLTAYFPHYVNIRFEKEIAYGHEIQSYFKENATADKETPVMTQHKITSLDQQEVFAEAQITWQKR